MKNVLKVNFWRTVILLFYMEALYLPVLKAVVCNYEVMRMNRLRLTQMYLCRFYIPDLIRLANDIEVNPGPSPSNVDPSRIVHGLKRTVEDTESSTIPKVNEHTNHV